MFVFRRVFPMLRNPSCPCPALPIEIGQKPEFSAHDPGAGESNGWGCSRGRGNWGTLRIPREDWGTLGKIKGITTLPLRILLSFAKKTTGFLRGQCFTELVIILISFFFLVIISMMIFNNCPSQFFNDEFLCAFFFRFDVEGFWEKTPFSSNSW